MVTVEFLGPIGQKPMKIEAATLQDVADVLQKDEALTVWLESAAVAVNDKLVTDLSTKLSSGDKVSLLPPVCGG